MNATDTSNLRPALPHEAKNHLNGWCVYPGAVETEDGLFLPVDPTKVAIARALVESTGTNFLDSGGAYGRQWQRHQAMVAEATGKAAGDLTDAEIVAFFEARPAIELRSFGGDEAYPIIDVYHFLTERLSLEVDLDEAFREWATTGDQADEGWLTCAQEWPEAIGGTEIGTYYTYNNDNALSSDVHYTEFTHPETDERVVVLSIHGGCDARGGFTTPRVFTLGGYDDYFGYDVNDWSIYCPGRPRPEGELFEVADGYFDAHQTSSDEFMGDLDVIDAATCSVRCPECGGAAFVEGPCAS